jgi:hypothetical protein
MNDIFTVTVGGKAFQTTRTVLQQGGVGTFFSSAASQEENYVDIEGRSNTYFDHIVKFMEDGSLPTSVPLHVLLWLKREFHFYSFELPPAAPRESIFLVNNRVTELDVVTGHKHSLSSTAFPLPREEYVVQSINGKIYRFGGSNSDTMESYDLSTQTWDDTLEPMEGLHSEHVATVVGPYLYVLDVVVFERYDTRRGEWETMSNLSVEAGAMCAVGTDIYMFSGSFYSDDKGASCDTYKYDTLEDQWNVMKGSPVPPSLGLITYSTAVVGDKVYLTSTENDNGTFYRFDPTTGAFTELAPLAERKERSKTIVVKNGNIYAIHPEGTDYYDMGTNRWIQSSTTKIIGVETGLICSVQTGEAPFMETRLDDLITRALDAQRIILCAEKLQSIINEERLQCTVRCKSGKRCKNRAVREGQCHLQGNHGTLCDNDETPSTVRLGGGHEVHVSAEARFRIPKSADLDLDLDLDLECQSIHRPVKSPASLNSIKY